MAWSLALRNGDLTLGQAQYGTVTNEAKLVQDLRCWILERMGTDDMHPNFGALIDGGTAADGTERAGVIGTTDIDLAQTLVESEIWRIVREYQAQQLARAKSERQTYGKTTFTKGEVLVRLEHVELQQSLDSLNVHLFIVTAADTQIDLSLTFNF